MKRVLAVALLVLASACAQTPESRSGPDGRKASGDNPRARIHTELATEYFKRGQYAVALDELAAALSGDSAYAPAHNILGLVHGALGEDDKAEAGFKRALELAPKYSEAHNNYGWFLCQRGRYAAALERFESALADPLYGSPELALANAGLCSLRKGDVSVAEGYLQRSLRRAPEQPVAVLGLAELHFVQGRDLSVRQLLKQLNQTTGLTAQALWLGVRTERRQGDQAAEYSYAAQLRRLYPLSQEARWLDGGQYDQPRGQL